VVTHPNLFRPPTPVDEAWESVTGLLASPSLLVIAEGESHSRILGDLIRLSGATGNGLQDAHIAALLIEHAVDEIITADEDFRRFPGLKVTNPFLQ
jgi:predicted nucleic acid-binding protein